VKLPRRALLAAMPLLAGAGTAPGIRQIRLPSFPGRHAIWGATGQDSAGRVWFGVSAEGGSKSGHLFRYDPDADRVTPMGDVRSELARQGPRPPAESQIKLHSRITGAGDGFLYFTSTDEEGELEDGSAAPRWGSHFWRIRESGRDWEHLAEVPEGLTCAGAAAGTAWALGLWGHVLYRYDTATRRIERRVIGAPGGHMSRNLVVDHRGHAYVPRVRLEGGALTAQLVEIAPDMREIAATPLRSYAAGPNPGAAQGIIGLTTLQDRSIVLATSQGFLHRIHPGAGVEDLGFLHPDGPAFTSSLFARGNGVEGLARRVDPGGEWRREHWEWITLDLASFARSRTAFETGITPVPVLYGSDVRDAAGRVYIGGRRRVGADRLPVLLQVTP
jgi:hypothetical protein